MTLGEGTFGEGTFGEPIPSTPINIVEPDGSVHAEPDTYPHSYLRDGTGIRLRMRFITEGEGLATYDGLVRVFMTYSEVKAHYASYDAIQLDPILAVDIDTDVTCFVAGIYARSGRSGLFDDIDASTMTVSLIDNLGLFDPRWENTVFGPGRRIRTGTWTRLELWRPTTGWVPLMTGLTDGWSRTINPDEDITATITVTDFFAGLATAHASGALGAQVTGARIQTLLDSYWNPAWGTDTVAAGSTLLYADTIDDATVLGLIRAAAQVDDGRVFVAADGTFVYEDASWRNGRPTEVLLLGRGATAFEDLLSACTYDNIALQWASYDDVAAGFLIYDDMTVCSGGGNIPTACTSTFTVADDDEDVVNEIVLEWKPAAGGASTFYRARDDDSVERYGERGYKRSDLTPNDPSMLATLAETLLGRWKSGDANVSSVGVDLLRDNAGVDALLTLRSGDIVLAVDAIPPEIPSLSGYDLSEAEVMGVQWRLGPDTFTLALTLDQVRAFNTTPFTAMEVTDGRQGSNGSEGRAGGTGTDAIEVQEVEGNH